MGKEIDSQSTNNDMDKISIITICYNCKDALERTIKSVVSQTYPAKEYVVVDGGSIDGTLDIIRKYKDDIDITISELDEGIYNALNKGIRKATGKWIICMNAGDEFAENDVLSKIFSLKIPPEKKFLYSDFWLRTKDEDKVHAKTDRYKGDILHQSSIYLKELHSTYGYYVETHPYIASDLLFFLSVPEKFFMKVPYEISINDFGGVSSGLWCTECALGLKTAFRIKSINAAYAEYIRIRFIQSIPYKWRRFIRKHILPK
jgi:glycosyltransferase involved in cell wall biosynthesis